MVGITVGSTVEEMVGEVGEERRYKKMVHLMPNFRSISPSIFNIDLNKTGEMSHA